MRVTATSAICLRPSCEAGFEIGWRRYWARAGAQATESSPKSVETTLHELSRHMLDQASMPDCATLQRILAAQAVQFPELAKLAHEDGWLRGVRGVAILLQQFAARGEIKVDDPELAADMFLNLLLGDSARPPIHPLATDPEVLQ